MPILLPLSLVGFGYLIYQLFAGATLALPIALGVAAGFAAHQLGCSTFASFVIGVIAFMGVIAASRVVALKLTKTYARITLALLFAVPAALTGYSLAHALGVVLGTTGIVAGLVAAMACAAIAAERMLRPAI
ncbi:hypothetical protein [Sphingomonas nostoxanthinifaciens]|uniref:hypothetical protein n=1 Tax=Sphingomonas nostoxanthinifaciens TaxID=2872652 RepID=UPI001CC1D2EB|nr:hypothetical protein [Sphingomonas nostoxanthinifaciens]UAK25308.1 hypothetical protein K8P63_03720 [Sphingomonas nostoxanthinifaciens]